MRIALVVVSLLWIPAHVLAGGAVRAMTGAGRARWAVGDGGLVLRSDDAGASWREVAVPVEGDFTAVAFEDDKTGHIFGGRCVPGHPGGATVGVILRTRDAGRTWKALPAGPLAHLHGGWTRGLRAVVFGRPTPRQPTGLWATVTGGRIWIPLRVRGTGALLGGDALGVNNACLVGPGHRIVHLHRLDELTTGEAPMAADAALTAVAFAGVRSIWAAGENGSALRYSGPSAGWQALSLPLPVGTRRLADLEAVAAWGDREAIFAGGPAGAIFHTTDAGKTFVRLAAPRPGPIHALHRDEGGTLLAGADGGRIFRSTNAGKNWRLVHGAESVDVLFISAPGDVSSLPALAAHAASGLSVAVLQAALPATRDGLRGDVALRSSAAAAGADGAHVLADFASVAGVPASRKLRAEDILQRWSAVLDVPARREMLRQVAAAVRLYRPAVVALGPDGHEGRGPAAESQLVSRIAAEGVKLAADAEAFPELDKLGLKPWRVARTFTGFDQNARYVAPWEKPARPPRENLAAAFTGWRYPKSADTSVAMLASRAGWRLPWVGPMDRAATVTAFGCSEVLAPAGRLFTAGLSPVRMRVQSPPPVSHAVASGSLLRAAGLGGRNVAVTAAPLADAARKHRNDPLPADMLYLLHTHFMVAGRLAEAADVNRTLLSVGRAHPLYGRINIASVAMATSSEWRARLLRFRPGPAHPPGAGALRFEAVLSRLLEPRWRAWVADEHGAMLMGKAHAFVNDLDRARVAYGQLAGFARDRRWRSAAAVELAALRGTAYAMAAGDTLTAHPADGDVRLDGRYDERFWKDARRIKLSGPGGGGAAAFARLAALPRGLAVAVRIQADRPGDDGTEPAADWSLRLAVDADRDAWTQLLLTCDSTGSRRLELRTRLAASAALKAKLIGLQARRIDSGWSVEMLVPHGLMGTAPGRTELIRAQIQIKVGPEPKPHVLHLHPQSDDLLLPHRYALLALPATRATGAPPARGKAPR